ncbi:MAG: PAS domain-containing protein, partial [Panacagrimonas sp.]
MAPDVVLDGLTTAVICLDAKLAVASINSAGESLFEVGRRHAVGEPLAQVVSAFAPHSARLEGALESGTGFIEREMALRRSGESITVDCTVTPILLGKGTGLLIECLALDRHLRISRDELLLSQHQASRELI